MTHHDISAASSSPVPLGGGAVPKWAAVVDDTLVPLPRRRLRSRDILAQAGAQGILIRDYNQRADLPLEPDLEIDLAAGNVFRTADLCSAPPPNGHPDAPAKLAFVADDSWEVTTDPLQTLESLKGLFDLPEDAEVLRDYESPIDEPIASGVPVQFEDGPVFRILLKSITVKVNNNSVRFTKRRVTGLEIKQTAIEQAVAIETGFVLYPVKPQGGLGKAIGDTEIVTLRACDEFRCVAPDDNS
ncbi:MAG TPA: multiubiquitin domain-containing protein [Thermoanaerobaculia bacterium]|jgi:hypothetical protein